MKVHPLEPGLPLATIQLRIVNTEVNHQHVSSRRLPEEHVSAILHELALSDNGGIPIKGPLCNKPGLVNVKITQLAFKSSRRLGFRKKGRVCWRATAQTHTRLVQALEQLPKGGSLVATVSLPDWSSKGFSEDNSGFVLWYTPFGRNGPYCGYGNELRDEQYWTAQYRTPVPKLRIAHLFAHRYAKRRKRLSDRMEYHFGVLLEWDHQLFTTVVELAWQNGVGGYDGRSNWVDESEHLYKVMPNELKIPMQPSRTEIRLFDHPAKGSEELLAYMKARSDRFLYPSILQSNAITLPTNAATQLPAHLLQYCNKNPKYSLLRNNCQTFAVDLFMLLTQQKSLKPFIPVRLFYRQKLRDFFIPSKDQRT